MQGRGGVVQQSARNLADLAGFLRSLLFTIPFIYAWTMVMGFVSLLVSPFDRTARRQHACARFWSRLILWTSLVRLRVRNLEEVDWARAYVVVANHQSYIDTAVVFAALPTQFRIMAKASVFAIPFLGWHLRRTGNLPASRRKPYQAAKRLLEAASFIRQGHSLVVFPEGGRNLELTVGEFKTGVFLTAIRAGVPVVPLTIRGSRAVLPPYSWHIRPGTIEVIVGRPVETHSFTEDQVQELSTLVRARIAQHFA